MTHTNQSLRRDCNSRVFFRWEELCFCTTKRNKRWIPNAFMEHYSGPQSIDVLKNSKIAEFKGNFARYLVDLQFLPKFRQCCMVHLEGYGHGIWYWKIGIPDKPFCIYFSINGWTDNVFWCVSYSFYLGSGFFFDQTNYPYIIQNLPKCIGDWNDLGMWTWTLYDVFVCC